MESVARGRGRCEVWLADASRIFPSSSFSRKVGECSSRTDSMIRT